MPPYRQAAWRTARGRAGRYPRWPSRARARRPRSRCRYEAQPIARPEARRRIGGRVEEAQGCSADEIPTAGTLNGIDPGLMTRDPDRTRGDTQARRRQPRHRDFVWDRAAVGET